MLTLKKNLLLTVVFAGTSILASGAICANVESSESAESAGSKIERQNTVSLELLGRGGLYSFDYDRHVTENISVGAGISHYSISMGAANAGATLLPIYANYYFTKGTSRFFGTAGTDLIFTSGSGGDGMVKGSGVAAVVGAGYEYRADNGFLFRAAPYLLVGNASGAWLGLSVGYTL